MSIKNSVQLIGNIGKNLTVKTLESGSKVANFSLATNEVYTNKDGERIKNTHWHNIVAWGKTAKIIKKYVKEGSLIGVLGKLQSRSYEKEDKTKVYITEVNVNEVLFLDNK